MTSVQNPNLRKITGLLDTKEKVRELKRNLGKATEAPLRSFRKARASTWANSRLIVLD